MGAFCDRCKEYLFSSRGDCRCTLHEITDEDGEEHEGIWATSERDAALKFAESSNVEGDYWLMNESSESTVNGKPYVISAEPDVHYSASEKTK